MGRIVGRIFGSSCFAGLGPDFDLWIGGPIHTTHLMLANARAAVLELTRGPMLSMYGSQVVGFVVGFSDFEIRCFWVLISACRSGVVQHIRVAFSTAWLAVLVTIRGPMSRYLWPAQLSVFNRIFEIRRFQSRFRLVDHVEHKW